MPNSTYPISELTQEQLHQGMSVYFKTKLTRQDIKAFAQLTGDVNPLHIDAEYGKRSSFGENISHGLLSASLFSTIVGVLLPGRYALLNSIEVRFPKPIPVNSEVVVSGRVCFVQKTYHALSLNLLIFLNEEPCVTARAQVTILNQTDTPKRKA